MAQESNPGVKSDQFPFPGGRHGKRSAAEHEGKEKAEGRVEQEEEGRPCRFAVCRRPGADADEERAVREEIETLFASTPPRGESCKGTFSRWDCRIRRPDCPSRSNLRAHPARIAPGKARASRSR